MSIWVFNGPSDVTSEVIQLIYKSILDGKSRFGWSFVDEADLNNSRTKPWTEKTEKEKVCWQRTSFLLNIKKGDWVVHINVPEYGKCTAAEVVNEYHFDKNGIACSWGSDFRHALTIDTNSIITFDRNSPNVLPIISAKLKLRGRYWRIYLENEFHESIQNLKENKCSETGLNKNLHYFRKDLVNPLKNITELIHKNFNRKDLEILVAEVFKNIPNVIDVKENGSGYKSDRGADIIVTYQSGLPIPELSFENTLIVQVKSFAGDHLETNAVNQLKDGITTFNGDAGLLITTGYSTDKLENAINELSEELNKPISILSGGNLAAFILRYIGSDGNKMN